MTPDIKQDDLLLNDHQGKDYPVTIGKTDRITVLQLSAETVQCKVRLKRVLPQVINNLGERLLRSGCFLRNFFARRKE
jgi:hypothetical protein